jgi:hypothetical protein
MRTLRPTAAVLLTSWVLLTCCVLWAVVQG